MSDAADLTLIHDLKHAICSISFEGNFFKVRGFSKADGSIWHQQIMDGMSGQATAVTKWEWKTPFIGIWNGRIGFNKANSDCRWN